MVPIKQQNNNSTDLPSRSVMRYITLASCTLIGLGTVSGKHMARFFSGTEEQCSNKTWSEDLYAMASSRRNMDGSHLMGGGCNNKQPTKADNDGKAEEDKGPGPRQWVWVEAVGDKSYCLVMSEDVGCPEKGQSCMGGAQIDINKGQSSFCSIWELA